MIGQDALKAHLSSLCAMDRLPRFMLIAGAMGSGKQTLINWLMTTFELDHEVIEDQKIDSVRSIIASCYTLREKKFFIFPNAQNMNAQAQNALLKTLEEIPTNAYIIMTVSALSGILNTIRSRASVLMMEGYSRRELSNFTDDLTLLEMCSTPGQIKRYQEMDLHSLLEHCKKVVDNIGRINLGNIFNILKQVEEKNYDLIIPVMQYIFWNKVKDGQTVVEQFKVIQDASKTLTHTTTANVRNVLETMFIRLWEVS